MRPPASRQQGRARKGPNLEWVLLPPHIFTGSLPAGENSLPEVCRPAKRMAKRPERVRWGGAAQKSGAPISPSFFAKNSAGPRLWIGLWPSLSDALHFYPAPMPPSAAAGLAL